MIRGITFDFGGTIVTGGLQKDAFQQALLDYLNSLGYVGGEMELKTVMRRMLISLTRVRHQNREMRLEDLYTGVLCSFGIDPEREVLDHIHHLYTRFFKTEVISGVEQIFQILKVHFSLAIISNAMSDVPRYTLKKAGLDAYFKSIVLSRDLGVRKPDSEIFNFTLFNLGITNHDAIHVGDSMEQDVQGAQNAGMKAIWIMGEKANRHVKPDYIIKSIEELPLLLEASFWD